MMRRIFAVPALLLAAALHAAPAAAQTAAPAGTPSPQVEREVLAVVDRLFDAMRARDSLAVRAVFAPGALLTGMRPAPGGAAGLRVQTITAEEFARYVGADRRAPWIERAFRPEVRVDGTLATVWAEYDFHFGTTFSHCGTDAVQLLRFPEGWKIVSIADTFQREGCPPRPAPAG